MIQRGVRKCCLRGGQAAVCFQGPTQRMGFCPGRFALPPSPNRADSDPVLPASARELPVTDEEGQVGGPGGPSAGPVQTSV